MQEFLEALRHLLRQAGFRPGGFAALGTLALVFLAFGVLVPWRQGYGMFDPLLMVAYAGVGLLFTTPAVPALLSSFPPDHASGILPRTAAGALYGWLVSALLYMSGVVTVNLTQKFPEPVLPSRTAFWAVFLAALAGCLAAAAIAAFLTIRFSGKAAQSAMRLLFLAALVAVVLRSRLMDQSLLDSLTELTTTESLPRAGTTFGLASLAIFALFVFLTIVRLRRAAVAA